MNNPYMELMAELSGPGEDWREQAECRNHDPEIWFTDGKDDKGNRLKVIQAKSICRTCPVQVQCLDWARTNRQHYGVWGGEKMAEPKNRERDYCVRGHDWNPETTYLDPYGHRRCIRCRKENQERRSATKRERRRAAHEGVSA